MRQATCRTTLTTTRTAVTSGRTSASSISRRVLPSSRMLGLVMLPLRRRWPVRRVVSPTVLPAAVELAMELPVVELAAAELAAERRPLLVRLPPTGCRQVKMLP